MSIYKLEVEKAAERNARLVEHGTPIPTDTRTAIQRMMDEKDARIAELEKQNESLMSRNYQLKQDVQNASGLRASMCGQIMSLKVVVGKLIEYTIDDVPADIITKAKKLL